MWHSVTLFPLRVSAKYSREDLALLRICPVEKLRNVQRLTDKEVKQVLARPCSRLVIINGADLYIDKENLYDVFFI